MSNDKFLQLENIYKTFPLAGVKEYQAVVDVNLNIIKNDLETELKNLKKYIKDRYTLDDLL